MAKKVLVRAIVDGHDGRQYQAQGKTFYVDAERLKDGSTWFEPVKGSDEPEGDGNAPTE